MSGHLLMRMLDILRIVRQTDPPIRVEKAPPKNPRSAAASPEDGGHPDQIILKCNDQVDGLLAC